MVDRPSRSPEVAKDNPVYTPPFLGSRVAKGIALDDIAAYLNLTIVRLNRPFAVRATAGGRAG